MAASQESGAQANGTQAQVAPVPQRGFRTKSASEYIDYSSEFLRKARQGKTKVKGPKYRKIGRTVIYERKWLDEWLEQFEQVAE